MKRKFILGLGAISAFATIPMVAAIFNLIFNLTMCFKGKSLWWSF
ncbi:variable surface lipoprotein [Mycoplasmopsis bovis]|nr:variable surface lipoprotein [Mycoplasmopsis bovis]